MNTIGCQWWKLHGSTLRGWQIVPPFIHQRPRGVIYQHDNARPHRARMVLDFLDANDLIVLPCAACSPDMSPIEHCWDVMDRRVRSRQQLPANRQDQVDSLQEEWHRIPRDVIRWLTFSVRRRAFACTEARGGHTICWQANFFSLITFCIANTIEHQIASLFGHLWWVYGPVHVVFLGKLMT